MANTPKSLLVRLGCRVSEVGSRLFAHPYMQVAVLVFCAAWFLLKCDDGLLTAALSILAITLTQMVLNGQYNREEEAHKRDIAMHAKLDELIMATKRARDEMAGIEELDEDEIHALRDQAKEAIDAQGLRAGEKEERDVAKAAIDRTADKVQKQVDERKANAA